ncbi:MAG: hypothetical protein M1823_001046 [Watsoniomyces obsoletus]|nr:MAG: hypothetical protein M1823_001046 [Watsoniomyces obsoletus]
MTTTNSSPVEAPPSLLDIPADVFLSILHHLPTQDVKNLSLVNKSLATSHWILNHLYQSPFQPEDFITHHYLDAPSDSEESRPLQGGEDGGRLRFRRFITTLTHRQEAYGVYIRQIAMPHYARLQDFGLLQNSCPNLHSLDLSHIAEEYYFGNRGGYTWNELTKTYPTLFRRLKFLKIDVSVHARSTSIKLSNTATRTRTPPADNNEGEGGGGLNILLEASPNLETLALVGPRARSWTRVECQDELSLAISSAAGPGLRMIELWDMAGCIRNFRRFLEPLRQLEHLRKIAINFNETLHFFTRDGDVDDYFLRRHRHRREGDLEKKGSEKLLYTSTMKDLGEYLIELKDLVDGGRWDITSLNDRQEGVEVRCDPRQLYSLLLGTTTNSHEGNGSSSRNGNEEDDGYEILLRFMKTHLAWNPLLSWEGLIQPSYPREHTSLSSLSLIQRGIELSTLEELFKAMRSIGVLVKVEVSASHSHTSSRSFFGGGNSSSMSTEDWFLNDRLAPLVDELRITYGDTEGDNPPVMIRPGRPGGGTRECWHGKRKGKKKGKEGIISSDVDVDMDVEVQRRGQAEDILAFRPLWKIFQERFTGLRCLEVDVPQFVFRGWTERELEEVLGGEGGRKWVVRSRLDDDDSLSENDGLDLEGRVKAVYSRSLN